MTSKSLPRAMLVGTRILLEHSDAARELVQKSNFGTQHSDGSIELSEVEALYLLQKNKIEVVAKKDSLTFLALMRKVSRRDPNAWTKHCVFSALRERGYTVKTALKFGADFRVYDRGVKPGDDHARWLVYAMREKSRFGWYDFSAKNRVAHSTKKKLLIGVVDEEGDVSFWECRWIKP